MQCRIHRGSGGSTDGKCLVVQQGKPMAVPGWQPGNGNPVRRVPAAVDGVLYGIADAAVAEIELPSQRVVVAWSTHPVTMAARISRPALNER